MHGKKKKNLGHVAPWCLFQFERSTKYVIKGLEFQSRKAHVVSTNSAGIIPFGKSLTKFSCVKLLNCVIQRQISCSVVLNTAALSNNRCGHGERGLWLCNSSSHACTLWKRGFLAALVHLYGKGDKRRRSISQSRSVAASTKQPLMRSMCCCQDL